MKNTIAKNILLVVEGLLGIGALVLILISMFGNVASNLPLTCGLGCTGLAGILSVVLLVMNNKESKK